MDQGAVRVETELSVAPDSHARSSDRKNRSRRRQRLDVELVQEVKAQQEPIKVGKEEERRRRDAFESKKAFKKRVLSDAKFQRRNNRLRAENILLDDHMTRQYARLVSDPRSISKWFKSSSLVRDAAAFCGIELEDILPQTLDKGKSPFRAPRTWCKEHRSLVREQTEKRRKRNLRRVIAATMEVTAHRKAASKKKEDERNIRAERKMKHTIETRREEEDRERVRRSRRNNALIRRQEKAKRHAERIEEQVRLAAKRLEKLALYRKDKLKLQKRLVRKKNDAPRDPACIEEDTLEVQRERLDRRMRNATELRRDANKNRTLLQQSKLRKQRVARRRRFVARQKELSNITALARFSTFTDEFPTLRVDRALFYQ